MTVTIFSFTMSILFSTTFIVAIHLLRNRRFFLQSFGVHTVLLLYGLCFFRTIFPLELPFTIPVGLRHFYSRMYKVVWETKVPIGNSSAELLDVLRVIWLLVAAALAVQFLWENFRINRLLSRFAGNTDAHAEAILEKVKTEAWRNPKASLCICPSVEGPISAGLFRKRIYLPDTDYSEEELYYILKHEYTHLCSRDLMIKFLVRLFCCVFWWNPAVYLLKQDVAQIIEIKCDMTSTRHFAKEGRLAYLSTILRVLGDKKRVSSYPESFLCTGFMPWERKGTHEEEVLERFNFITNALRPVSDVYQVVFWVVAIAAVILSYTFVLQPAYDPPVEDIFTSNSIQECDPEELYLLQHKDKTYSLVLANGGIYPMSEKTAQVYIEAGIKIQKED